MASIVKRSFAGLYASFFLLWSILLPVTAHAATYSAASNLSGRAWAVPMTGTGIAGNPIVASAATMLGRMSPWINGLMLGTAVFKFILETKDGKQVAIVPRGLQQPVESWPNGVPPSTTPYGFVSGGFYADSALGACQLNAATFQDSTTERCPGASPYTSADQKVCYQQMKVRTNSYCGGNWSSPIAKGCPSGYSLASDGSACNLANASQVKYPPDNIPSFMPSPDGTTLIPDPRDPDAAPAHPTIEEIINTPGNYDNDPYGNPASHQIKPSSEGYTIDQRVQTTNNNQTTTTINNISINNAGQITNIFTTTVPGSIQQASPTATPVSGSSNIQFPTDYNREVTQQAVKQTLDDIKTGQGAETAPEFSQEVDTKKQEMKDAIKEQLDPIPNEFNSDKSKWFSWVWTPPVGSCSPLTSTIHGQSVVWNICPYVEKIRDVIGFLMAIGGAWLVYNQMFRRDEA